MCCFKNYIVVNKLKNIGKGVKGKRIKFLGRGGISCGGQYSLEVER